MNFDALIAALAGTPALPGARCRGQHALFDPPDGEQVNSTDVQARYAKALELCADCPALELCGDWLKSLPMSKRPGGVVAGQVRTHKSWQRRQAS